jgi:error-prone DNA polymerase
VCSSDLAWDSTLEEKDDPRERRRPVRLGLHQIKGLKKEADGAALVRARDAGARSVQDFARLGGFSRRSLELLAEADAFRSLGLTRREALWAVKGLAGEWNAAKDAPLLLRQKTREAQVQLPFMAASQRVAEDYRTTSLSLSGHPIDFFRPDLARRGVLTCAQVRESRNRRRGAVGGLVLVRQRPGTAKGVVFMTLEDETGVANVVVWRDAFEANRRTVMGASFLVVHGQIQNVDGVVHLVAEHFEDLSPRLAELREDQAPIAARSNVTGRLIRSRDFH